MHSHGQDEFLRTAHSDYDVVVCLEGADVVDPEAVRDARSGRSGAAALHEFSAVRRACRRVGQEGRARPRQLLRLPFVAAGLGGECGEEGIGEHGQGYMPMPPGTAVAATSSLTVVLVYDRAP